MRWLFLVYAPNMKVQNRKRPGNVVKNVMKLIWTVKNFQITCL